jgi:glycosyltransferase involved in cell wall biosynthesis
MDQLSFNARASALKDWSRVTREREEQKLGPPRPLAGSNENVARTVNDYTRWLHAFETSRGHKLRVLHIGNIANNGYLVAKFLRRIGIEADVLCYDYYHVMGTPEWEDIPIKHDYGDDFRPRFSGEDIGNYERPRWFVSGPFSLSVKYLLALRGNDQKRCDRLWASLERARLGYDPGDVNIVERASSPAANLWQWLRRFPRKAAIFAIMLPYTLLRILGRIIHRSLRAFGLRNEAAAFVRWAQRLSVVQDLISPLVVARAILESGAFDLGRLHKLKEDFATFFPSRMDQLKLSDFVPYLGIMAPLETLFKRYDIIQTYATDPILPLICNKRPFIAFEHGTLREFIRENNSLHRLTALAYRKADHVFITNGDCLEHARWLGCENATAMLHPVDVQQHRQRDEMSIADLRSHYGADVLLFCPIRHDWSIKGTDVHIRAVPEIRRRVAGNVVMVLAPWGLQVEDSKRLIKSLGCEASVAWLERPLCRSELILHMQAADVVLDQMTLPHFGATAPQALAAGTPVIMSYKEESTAWIVDEPAPILAAFSPEEVTSAVVTAIDPHWRAEFENRARAWVDTHHHNDRMVRDHLAVYRRILEESDVTG